MVGLEASGKKSTCRPLGRRYSVMPSTAVTFVGGPDATLPAAGLAAGLRGTASGKPFCGDPGATTGGLLGISGAGGGDWAKAAAMHSAPKAGAGRRFSLMKGDSSGGNID